MNTFKLSESHIECLSEILNSDYHLEDNYISISNKSIYSNQSQTNSVFSNKWERFNSNLEKSKLYEFQREWFLSLYGFESEQQLKSYLEGCSVVLDAGCGLGYKSAWFAELSPKTLVIGMDYSDSCRIAAQEYLDLNNLIFVQGDIANTNFKSSSIAFVVCDQVIMHTEDPSLTFSELSRVCNKQKGQFACYFYAKKALPRELLDDHFRLYTLELSMNELWEMSEQLTELGRRLSKLNIKVDIPSIPALGIEGGNYDLQRFIYWNFIKCFWNEEMGRETSIATNYDWYSPSNAKRFSRDEVLELVSTNGMEVESFHSEQACFSGRFRFNAES